MKEVTSKSIIKEMLRKLAITARVGIERGEWTEEECLSFIKEKGNKYINRCLTMDEPTFALLTFSSLAKSELEIKREILRREKMIKEMEEEDD